MTITRLTENKVQISFTLTGQVSFKILEWLSQTYHTINVSEC